MEGKNYYCQYCIYSQPRLDLSTGRACNKFQMEVSDTDFCSQFTKQTFKCEICGGEFPGQPKFLVMKSDDSGKTFKFDVAVCGQCNSQLGQCRTCTNANVCEFETNPSPLPKVVQKTITQGNMQAVTQVMNPERVAITCENGCHCWDPNFGCSKQNRGTCQQYHMNRV